MSVTKHRLSSDIAQVDDLLLDGDQMFRYTRKPDDRTAILTNLRTGEEVTFAPERILAMKLIVPGAIVQTGGAPHHIVEIENNHITFTAGDGEPQGMHAVFYADTLAAVRRRNYGPLGKQTPDAEADALAAELDAAADELLDDAGVPDLEADAALPELFDDDLPPADDEELPPGEPIELPTYQKGDRLWTTAGREYRVMSVDADFVRVKHESGEMYIPQADMPSLLREKPAPVVEPNWEDEVVRISAELIQAQTRIRQLEDELARLHDESRDTEPLAPETVAEAARASQEMARVEVVRWDDVKVESILLPPVNLFDPKAAAERNREIVRLRNAVEKWYVVFEAAEYAISDGHQSSMHVARLERHVEKDDDPRGDGQPEHKDILDLAREVLGEDDEPAEQPDADAEDLETETDLAPVTSATPISDAIRAHGLEAVKSFYDTQLCAAFNLGSRRALESEASS